MAAFTAAAVAGLLADVRVGGLIVAAGIGAHGVWDVVHHRRDRVVTRSYAEFCAVTDVLLAALLVRAVVQA